MAVNLHRHLGLQPNSGFRGQKELQHPRHMANKGAFTQDVCSPFMEKPARANYSFTAPFAPDA